MADPPGRRRSRVRRSWFGRHPVTSGGAAVLIALVAWLFPRPEPVAGSAEVPDVTGVTVSVAEAVLSGRGLVPLSEPGPAGPSPGTVVAQDPAAGTRVDEGSRVVLVVETSSATVAVPELLGLSVRDAEQLLAGSGLQLVRAGTQQDGDVPADTVLTQSPAADTVVERGSAVDVTLSTAPPEPARPVLVEVRADRVDGSVVALDLTVRNDGSQVAVITQVHLVVEEYSGVPAVSGPLPASAAYDVTLPDLSSGAQALPLTVVVPVSQVVDPLGPGAVDRFVVRVAPAGAPGLIHRYTVRVRVEESSSVVEWPWPFELVLDGRRRTVVDPGGPGPFTDEPAPVRTEDALAGG